MQKLASLGAHLLNREIDRKTWEEELVPAVIVTWPIILNQAVVQAHVLPPSRKAQK